MFELLTAMIRRYAMANPHEFVHVRKEKKSRLDVETPFKPGLGVAAHPSESLKKDIKEGHVIGLQLVKTISKYGGGDKEDLVEEVEAKITAHIKPTTSTKEVFKAVKWFAKTLGEKDKTQNIRIILAGEQSTRRPLLTLESCARGSRRYSLHEGR
jgi:hypothetical protein